MSMEIPQRKSLIAPLVTTAAVLGIIQGFAWFILSLLAVLLYEEKILPTTSNNVPVGRLLFAVYFNKTVQISDHGSISTSVVTEPTALGRIIIGSRELNYFMYFYIIFSFLLLVISLAVLWASISGKAKKYNELRLWSWITNMIILALVDFILVCLIAHDYHQVKKIEIPDNTETTTVFLAVKTLILVTVGILMTLAARGFVIWIINVIFVVILAKHLYYLRKSKKVSNPDPSILDAYNTGSSPPWELYADSNNRSGYNNKGFRNDNPMPISSSQSFTHLSPNDRENYENRDRDNQKGQNPYYGGQNNNWNKRSQSDNGLYGMGGNNSPLRPLSHADRSSDSPNRWGQPNLGRTAKIGRQGGQRSPPLNVNPPYIPDPDYSPPGSPRVRGVLRPKSNYAMY